MFYLKTQWEEFNNKTYKVLYIKLSKNINPFGELRV